MSTMKTGRNQKSPVRNGKADVGEVLTLSEAASFLRVPEEMVLQMVRSQGLMARKIGSEWRFLKSALENWLGGSTKSNKQILLDLAGTFKDDPYLEEITREAYRRRREGT